MGWLQVVGAFPVSFVSVMILVCIAGGHPDPLSRDLRPLPGLARRRVPEFCVPPPASATPRLALRRRQSRSSARVRLGPDAGIK